jgi:hypothetical protein
LRTDHFLADESAKPNRRRGVGSVRKDMGGGVPLPWIGSRQD